MCYNCETDKKHGVYMKLRPLDLASAKKTIKLPEIWRTLEDRGFHEDIVLRAYAHMAWCIRKSDETGDATCAHNAGVFLSSIGKGFVHAWKRDAFLPKEGDRYFDLKMKALDAITELAAFYGDRVSAVQWNAFAHLATREEPEEKKSILKEAADGQLPHHYGILDNKLHAAGKVYTFMLHVQSVFFAHTGMILVHNCDCDCSLLNLQPVDGCIKFSIAGKQVFEATQSLFTHQCAESHLILDEKLPFEYTITGDAIAVLGLH